MGVCEAHCPWCVRACVGPRGWQKFPQNAAEVADAAPCTAKVWAKGALLVGNDFPWSSVVPGARSVFIALRKRGRKTSQRERDPIAPVLQVEIKMENRRIAEISIMRRDTGQDPFILLWKRVAVFRRSPRAGD